MVRLLTIILTMLAVVPAAMIANAQHSAEATLAKFTQLTSMFHGKDPFSCLAIVDVKYKSTPDALRDTSTLIYRNGSTYYKSRLVEHVEAAEGELIVNHQLKTASFHVSDSIKDILVKKLDLKPDKELEAMLDSNSESKDLGDFNQYLVSQCYIAWTTRDGLQEISFTPKNPKSATLLSLVIRFDKDSRVRYYEYTNRDVYAKDWHGDSRFRLVRTIYDNFRYDQVSDTPSRLSDFIEWNGWAIKLKKHTNYKFSVL